jgi:hypothetical protein
MTAGVRGDWLLVRDRVVSVEIDRCRNVVRRVRYTRFSCWFEGWNTTRWPLRFWLNIFVGFYVH